MHYIGVDYHKQYSYIVVKNEDGQVEERGSVSNTGEEFRQFLQPGETVRITTLDGVRLTVERGGGIGIMNIMLVSVTERTREIGMRKAIGAKRRDILLQFPLEAAVMSFAGSGIGTIGGWLLSLLISFLAIAAGITLYAVVTRDIVILAVSVSVIIGLVSGMYPTMRAAKLNPIDALRYG